MACDVDVMIGFESTLFVVLSSLVLSINKYVLSTLHFTVPTVFQGWQTLVCVAILTLLLKFSHFRLEIKKLERRKLLDALIPMALFTLSSVAGSKALADLPVAIFVAGGNLVPAGLAIVLWRRVGILHMKITGSIALFTTVLILYRMVDQPSAAWMWLSIHIVSLFMHTITLGPLRTSPTTCMYYCNFGAAVILLPLSVYLQEAHSAMNLARNAQIEFYVGCVLSGILGTCVQLLLSDRLSTRPNVTLYQGVGKILACTFSLIFFPDNLDVVAWWLVITNLILGCFLFTPNELSESKLNEPCVV